MPVGDMLHLTIVTGGSNNLSPSTSIQVISIASGSPGEHGVSKSSHTTSGSFGLGPVTLLKWVAVWTFLTGCIKASRTTILISAPEYPSLLFANSFKFSSVNWVGVLPKCNLNIVRRAGSSGNGIYILFSNLLRIAASNTHGIFVAPSTKMPSVSFPTPVNKKMIRNK